MNIQNHLPPFLLSALLESQKAFPSLKMYWVGGFVRDILLQRSSKDIDVLIEGVDVFEFCSLVAKKLGLENVQYFKNFGTCMLFYQGIQIEFVHARKESYLEDSRKPTITKAVLEEDLARRDFTINALAIPIDGESESKVIDLFGGLEDLKNGILRTPLDPVWTYSDDPLRMMRAIRFATQLQFKIEEKSWKAIIDQNQRLKIISQERITEELNKILMSPLPSLGLHLLQQSHLLEIFFPELIAMIGVEVREGKGHKDNFFHTLEVVDNLAKKNVHLWLRWAGLLHDIAKPLTKNFETQIGWTFHGHEEKGAHMVSKIFRKLRLPLDNKMKYVQKLVRLHLRPIALVKEEVTDSAARRLLFEAGDDFEDLMQLCLADITSKNEGRVTRIKNNFARVHAWIRKVEEKDQIKNFQPPIDGEEIMRIFALGPCKEIGQIKNIIKNAILEGEIANTKKAAYYLMIEKAAELGLKIKNNL